MATSLRSERPLQATWAGLVVIIGLATMSYGATPWEATEGIADRLLSAQVRTGAPAGSWPNESEFTGSIAAGLVGAYTLTCEPSFLAAAEEAGDYSLVASGGNYYGDEAYAFHRLSEASPDPDINAWRGALEVFYNRVKTGSKRTQGYVSQFAAIDPADAAFYLAHHVVAAYYVNAADRQIWRDALLDNLSRISDSSCSSPVAGVAIATWAIAKTGPLDAARIDRSGKAAPYWGGRMLLELPELLCGHQVPAEEEYAGSFYARLDHDFGPGKSPRSGYTEDLVFSLMALATIQEADPDPLVESAMAAAGRTLLAQLPKDGRTRQHLWLQSDEHHVYAGEALLSIEAAAVQGDIDLDGDVDLIDFAAMASRWRSSNDAHSCGDGRADVTGDRTVSFHDLAQLTSHWLVLTDSEQGGGK